jgi:ABC-2 type transport system permease protein
MSGVVLRRAWHDQRGTLLGWTASWFLLVGLYVASWPAVRHNGERYDEILRDLPTALRTLVASQGQGLGTPSGYLTAELLSLTGPWIAVAMGLLMGTRAVTADEEDGTLELLLAQPLSRTRLLLERVAAAVLGLVAALSAAAVALWALGLTVSLGLSLGAALRAMWVLALLGVEGLCLGALTGALVARVGRARALAGGVALGAFLLHALGPLVPWLTDVAHLSPFHTVVATAPFDRVPPPGLALALVVPAGVFLAAACRAFGQRDLRLG